MIFFSKNDVSANYDKVFFDFKINSISGEQIDLGNYKNKVILVVNTASYCGFTNQYNDLQLLWEKYKSEGLIVLGVPSNSFNQEKKEDSDVKEFCEVNFNINFPMTTITELKVKILMNYLNGQKKIMVNLLYLSGISTKF